MSRIYKKIELDNLILVMYNIITYFLNTHGGVHKCLF